MSEITGEKPVLVVGDANVDIIVHYPEILDREKKQVRFSTPMLQGGGTAANTAAALSKLGIPTAFLGTIGDDAYGRYIMEDFSSLGIDTSQMIVKKMVNTVGVFAFIDDTGERYLWGWPRVNQAFKEIDEESVDFEKVRQAAWVHTSGMAMVYDTSARSSIIKIIRTAFEAGVPTSLDLNLRADGGELDPVYREAILEAMKYCRYVLGSGDEEFVYLAPGENGVESARKFVTPERSVVVRLGKKGCIGISETEYYSEDIFPFEVVDTVGAGDVFNAGFIDAIVRGGTLRDGLVRGNAISGYAVSQDGARNTPGEAELASIIRREHKI